MPTWLSSMGSKALLTFDGSLSSMKDYQQWHASKLAVFAWLLCWKLTFKLWNGSVFHLMSCILNEGQKLYSLKHGMWSTPNNIRGVNLIFILGHIMEIMNILKVPAVAESVDKTEQNPLNISKKKYVSAFDNYSL